MKASRAWALALGEVGTGGLRRGLRDHQSVLSARAALAESGQAAPSSIQRRKRPIWAGLRGGSLGGMVASVETGDEMDEGALGAISGKDIGGVGIAAGEGEGFDVEAVGGFLFFGPVAFEAGLLEEGLDVLHKIHGAIGRGGQVGGGGAEGGGGEEDGEAEHARWLSWGLSRSFR